LEQGDERRSFWF